MPFEGKRDFETVEYVLTLKRKPHYYVYTVAMPCFLITLIALIGVFSPHSSSGDRSERVSESFQLVTLG